MVQQSQAASKLLERITTHPHRVSAYGVIQRHSREGGNPLPPKNLDSRLRGSDGQAI